MPQDMQELLRTLSNVMFPAEPDTPVRIDSVGYDGETPLHILAWRDDLCGVQLLVAAGADVNAIGEMGETPLHAAIHQGNTAMIQTMLRAGARTDIKSELGETPHELAKEYGGEIAALFVSATPPNTSFERTREG
jgi:ankyrin repeat protein